MCKKCKPNALNIYENITNDLKQIVNNFNNNICNGGLYIYKQKFGTVLPTFD